MLKSLLWLLLLVVCWPLALLALVLWPIVWLISLPFRLIGIAIEGVFTLLRTIVMLPARLLGWRPAASATRLSGSGQISPGRAAEELGFYVLVLFRQLAIESVNCQQDSAQPIRASSGDANVVER